MSQPIMVFDALDTIQGYKGAPLGGSKQFSLERTAEFAGMRVNDFLRMPPRRVQLWMTYSAQLKGDLESVMLPGAHEILSYIKSKGIRPVIVTDDIPESAALAMHPFTYAGIVDPADVHAISYLDNSTSILEQRLGGPRTGCKEYFFTWEYVRDRLRGSIIHCDDTNLDIKGVFEDSEANLGTAIVVFDTIGYLVNHTEPILKEPMLNIVLQRFDKDTGSRISSPRIVSGNLLVLMKELEKRLEGK